MVDITFFIFIKMTKDNHTSKENKSGSFKTFISALKPIQEWLWSNNSSNSNNVNINPASRPSTSLQPQNQQQNSIYPFSQLNQGFDGSLPQQRNMPRMPELPNNMFTIEPPRRSAVEHVSPLDYVPFEAKLTLNNSTNLITLDQLFREINKAAEVVERVDVYLRSSHSDYDFKTEQTLTYK